MSFEGGTHGQRYERLPDTLWFFPDDLQALKDLEQELSREVKDLGHKQGEASQRSTENMGHDDAEFESITNQRTLLVSRIDELRALLPRARSIELPTTTEQVHIGCIVTYTQQNGTPKTVQIGSYQVFTENPFPGVQRISYTSPIAQALLAAEVVDEEFTLPNKTTATITAIEIPPTE